MSALLCSGSMITNLEGMPVNGIKVGSITIEAWQSNDHPLPIIRVSAWLRGPYQEQAHQYQL